MDDDRARVALVATDVGLRTGRWRSGGARSRGCARGRLIGARRRGLIPRTGTDAGGFRFSGRVEPGRRRSPTRPDTSSPSRAAAQLAAQVEPAPAAALEAAEEHRVISVPSACGRREGRAPEQPRRDGERRRRRCRRALGAGDGEDAEWKRDEHEHGEHDFEPGAHRARVYVHGADRPRVRRFGLFRRRLAKRPNSIGGCASGDVRSDARVKQPASDGFRPIVASLGSVPRRKQLARPLRSCPRSARAGASWIPRDRRRLREGIAAGRRRPRGSSLTHPLGRREPPRQQPVGRRGRGPLIERPRPPVLVATSRRRCRRRGAVWSVAVSAPRLSP